MRKLLWMRMLLMAVVALLVAACASIGRPEGGPRDEDAPEYMHSWPAQGQLDVDGHRFSVSFNENIKLEDPSNKIVISPAQKQSPAISSNGKSVTVELRDTLVPNTTYTIDFSDAIRDLNEGNILDGFALDFSTGSQIDTLRISGMVFQASNLEPAQGMVVGVYSNLSDTALTTLPLERVAKTNQYGQFTIRGLKPGTYNIFAINDVNHDWRWDRSENIAFYPVTVSPSTEPMEVADTLLSSLRTDSVVTRQATRFLPDDVLLTWFNEDYKPYYLRDHKRTTRNNITLLFGARPDSIPELKVLTGPRAGRSLLDPEMTVIERRAQGDSLFFWLRDPGLMNTDSLMVKAVYQKNDSLDRPALYTDTLRLFFREHKSKKQKKAEEADSVAEQIFMTLKSTTSGTQDLNRPMRFETSEPIDSFPLTHFRLEMLSDSVWTDVPFGPAVADTLSTRFWEIPVKWEEGTRYRLTGDSLAIVNIYGDGIRPYKGEFTTAKLNDYGTVRLNLTDIPYDSLGPVQVVVELLDGQDQVVETAVIATGNSAMFPYLKPGKYYARAILDLNANGKWDRGDVASRTMPEDVVYYSKKLNVRRNWDLSQDWALFELPVDMQKPLEVKKNKPKTREPRQRDASDEEDEEYDDLNGSWGNGSQYNNAHRTPGRVTGGMQSVRTQQ